MRTIYLDSLVAAGTPVSCRPVLSGVKTILEPGKVVIVWAGITYLLLALASTALWAAGFDAYRCLTAACQEAAALLGRPLLLWGAVYFAAGSLICTGGLVARLKPVALGFLGGGAAVHAALLALAWNRAGSLCPVCALFLTAEVLLLIFVFVFPPAAFRRIPVALASVVLATAVSVLAINPAPPVSFSSSSSATPAPPGLTAGATLTVLTPEKTAATLDLKERPALLWAWWCPHCQKELRRLARQPAGKRPYLVLTFATNESDLEKARSKLAAAGIGNETLYILPDAKVDGIGIPTLLYWDERTQTVWAR